MLKNGSRDLEFILIILNPFHGLQKAVQKRQKHEYKIQELKHFKLDEWSMPAGPMP